MGKSLLYAHIKPVFLRGTMWPIGPFVFNFIQLLPWQTGSNLEQMVMHKQGS